VLKRQLPPCPRQVVGGGVRTGGELGQGQGRDRDLGRESRRIEGSQIDRDRCIDQAPAVTQASSEA
jgi:hypothetical protein